MLKRTLLCFFLFFTAAALTSFKEKESPKKALKTIIIDAGHGGKDQGAAGSTYTEAQICLELSLKLGKQIEEEMPGVKVLYTRTTDIFPGNKPTKKDGDRYRADFANQSGADLFISIHCNSAGKKPGGWYDKKIVSYDEKVTYTGKGSKKKRVVKKIPVYESFYVENTVKGTETFVWTAKENSHKEQMVNTSEFAEDEDGTEIPENDPVINALKLVYTKKYFVNSLRLADLVQQEFEKSGRFNRGVKQRNEKGIWVLHATGMPSILIEAGFITNKEEEEYLKSEQGQKEIVDDITNALKSYNTILSAPQPNTGTSTGKKHFNNKVGSTLGFLQSIEQKEKNPNVR